MTKVVKGTKYKENHYYTLLLAISFAAFLSVFTSFKITGDDDVFWHLATGRYIVENKYVPSTDVFGYMTEKDEWMPFEWGWDVLTYLLYQVAGIPGLSLLRTFMFLLIFALYLYLLRKFGISYVISFIYLFLLAFAIMDRLTPRPHLMSYLFFILLIIIICEYRYFDRGNYKKLFFIPLIFLIWANMHMGIIAGLFLLGIYVFSELLNFFFPKISRNSEIKPLEKRELIYLLGISILAILVMFLNPNFYQTYIYAYEHTKMKLLETVNEWFSPFHPTYSASLPIVLYKIFLFTGFFIVIYSFIKKDIFPALLYIGFAFYSIRAMRFVVDFDLILFVFIVVSHNYLFEKIGSVKFRNLIYRGPIPKVILSVFFIYLIVPISNNKFYLEFLRYYRVSGIGINEEFIPVQMFDFMKKNNVPQIGERIFNHFGTGGFFVWNFPDKKNFIDSRNLNDEIFDKYSQIISMKPGFEKKLNEYGIDYAIYLAPDLVRQPNEMQTTVISYFCRTPEWKLIFWDDKSFLWVKDLPKFADLISKYEYKYLTPYNYMYNREQIEKGIREDKEKVQEEYNRKINEEPNGVVINSIKVIYYNKIFNK
ncbi:MAG: hypothetical protein N2490_02095 [Ignavibacteria bacterium]|nr:hypothetical protein [Ignavibacteria bacterium]